MSQEQKVPRLQKKLVSHGNDHFTKQLLITLAYTDQFNFPLTAEELFQRKISLFNTKQHHKKQFLEALGKLVRMGRVTKESNYYYISKATPSLSNIRTNRQVYSDKKWQEVRALGKVLQKIPGISGVLVTGSLAMHNATQDDDIDLLIITKPHMLWLLRPLVVGYSWLKGKRRSWHREEKNSWCFNMWLDENHLQLPQQARSIYTAYELLQAKWVWVAPGFQRRYYLQNKWVKQLLPQYFSSILREVPRENPSTLQSGAFFTPFMAPLHLLIFFAQYLYMLPHKTTERVGYGYAFFHPRNTKQLVFRRWKETLLRL